MKFIKTALVAVIFLAWFSATESQEPGTEIAKLKGVWKIVSAQSLRPGAEERYLKQYLKFERDMWFVYDGAVQPDRLRAKVRFVLDAKKEPKHIDIYGESGGEKAKVPMPGIYAFDKEQLKISFSKLDGKDRPAKFDIDRDDPQSQQTTLVLERVKEEKK